MEKYFAFSRMLAFMAHHTEVVDADMNNWAGEIEITGVDDAHEIIVTVKIQDKEEKKDAEELE